MTKRELVEFLEEEYDDDVEIVLVTGFWSCLCTNKWVEDNKYGLDRSDFTLDGNILKIKANNR